MRIFVSYARVDKPYCVQIVDMLDVHEVWYDQRLYAGQDWWKEILRRLDWCEGFIYLLSPESVKSDYCRKEFELAQNLGRHIFPVLIHQKTDIPDALTDFQYADLSSGLTAETVRHLLNSIYLAERVKTSRPGTTLKSVPPEATPLETVDESSSVSLAAKAMENGQFDEAVFLLKQAKARGFKSRFINLDAILKEAEIALERQMVVREAERDYQQILALVNYKSTRRLGCEAFEVFQGAFPGYDPDNIADICSGAPLVKTVETPAEPRPKIPTIPLLEWCEIPAGNVKTENSQGESSPVSVDTFMMAKYPITNAQYQRFLDDPNGYNNLDWWQYSSVACAWRESNPTPRPPHFKGSERPREMVSWFDVTAFCHWLSAYLGFKITLPTLVQRQRVIQGDDERIFPWGEVFDKDKCNTRESELKMTTAVTRYEDGVSPYGVYDLAGNVWEWCLSAGYDSSTEPFDVPPDEKRIVHGGSFVSPHPRSQVSFYYQLPPNTLYTSIGFRVVQVK